MRKNYLIIARLSELRMTQSDLTRQAKISSDSRLSRIIHYLVEPSIEEKRTISRILGIDARSLFRREDEIS